MLLLRVQHCVVRKAHTLWLFFRQSELIAYRAHDAELYWYICVPCIRAVFQRTVHIADESLTRVMQKKPERVLRRHQITSHQRMLTHRIEMLHVAGETTEQAKAVSNILNLDLIRLRIQDVKAQAGISLDPSLLDIVHCALPIKYSISVTAYSDLSAWSPSFTTIRKSQL